MRESGADAGDFIGGYGDADAGAADGDAEVGLFGRDAITDGLSVIRIIHGVFGGGAAVVHGVSRGFEIFADDFFDGKAGVVGADDNARLGGRFGHER